MPLTREQALERAQKFAAQRFRSESEYAFGLADEYLAIQRETARELVAAGERRRTDMDRTSQGDLGAQIILQVQRERIPAAFTEDPTDDA